MRKTALTIALAGALSFPLAASAQIRASIEIGLPAVVPPAVVIQPGVQVIPEIDHEVFLVGGVYYARQGAEWYRAPSPRTASWVYVEPRAVPASLVKIPPGHYKNWKAEKEHEKAERKEAKRQEKAERKAFRHGKH